MTTSGTSGRSRGEKEALTEHYNLLYCPLKLDLRLFVRVI